MTFFPKNTLIFAFVTVLIIGFAAGYYLATRGKQKAIEPTLQKTVKKKKAPEKASVVSDEGIQEEGN